MPFDSRKKAYLRQLALANHNELAAALTAVTGQLGVASTTTGGARRGSSKSVAPPVVEVMITKMRNGQLSSPALEAFIDGALFSGRYRFETSHLPSISQHIEEGIQRHCSKFQLSRYLGQVVAGA